jgi:Protein of unknown function with HXXEE motif
MLNQTAHGETLNRTDFMIGTIIAVALGVAFTLLSSGLSLIVTFVPGLVFTWLVYFWLYHKQTKLPAGASFMPLFFTTLAVQFLHFAEEHATGFRTQFPLLYGGLPYTDNLFVSFNMLSYFVFTVGCLLLFTRQLRFLLVPVLFFVIYGALGNAISHTWWSLYLRGYFPGLVTAQAYWVLGPLVLYRLVGERKPVIWISVLFAVTLILLLTLFAVPNALKGN